MSAAIGALSVSGPVTAQSAPAPATPLPGATNEPAAKNPATETGIEQIVVTAQRRSESLQKVPLSVVAITGQQLKAADVTTIDRLQQIAPGLRIGRSGSDPRPAMRGTFTAAIQGNNDPRFGFYIDEIYQSRTSQLSMPFVDLERVEVQKGPQGTLYGRNSFGGNIAVTTSAPRNRFDAGFDLVYGKYNRKLAEGFINFPIAPDFAVRFAGAFEDRGPYINNIYNRRAVADDKHQYYFRGSARWSPAALDNRLEVLFRGSYWDEKDHGNGAFGSKPIGALFNSAYQIRPGGTLTLPGAAPITLPGGYTGYDQTSSVLIPYYVFYRDGIADINGADMGLPIPGPYTFYNDYEAHQRLKSTNLALAINYELGDFAKLRSITGYTKFSAFRTRDADGTPAPKGIGFFLTRDKSFSQEFQIQSNNRTSPLQYTAGVYYFHDEVPDAYIGEENRAYSTAGALATGGFPIYFNNYTFSPLVNYPSPLTANTTAALVTTARNDTVNPLTFLKTVSKAAYLQASYTLGQLTLTGGIRYTRDTKTFYSALQQSASGGNFAFSPGFGIAPSLSFNRTCDGYTAADPSSTATNKAQALLTRCGKKTFSFLTYRAAADYKFDADHMIYASVNTGRHAGGFSYSPRPGQTTLNPVDTENVTAFEVGSKNQFFDRRLQVNLAAYYNHYTNLQISVSYPNPVLPGSVSTYSQNGQTNNTPGVDLEILAKPTRNLTLNFAANYMHARDNPVLVSGASSNGLCSIGISTSCPLVGIGLGGGILPNPVSNPDLFVAVPGATTPTFNTLAFNQKARVQNQPDITLQGGASYDFNLGARGHVLAEWQTYFNGGYLLFVNTPNYKQKRYTKTDLRLTYFFPGDHLSIQGFVENLENKAVINRVTFSTYTYDGNYEAPRTYGVRLAWRY